MPSTFLLRRIFAFENGQINQYEGGYTDYQVRVQMAQAVEEVSNGNKNKQDFHR